MDDNHLLPFCFDDSSSLRLIQIFNLSNDPQIPGSSDEDRIEWILKSRNVSRRKIALCLQSESDSFLFEISRYICESWVTRSDYSFTKLLKSLVELSGVAHEEGEFAFLLIASFAKAYCKTFPHPLVDGGWGAVADLSYCLIGLISSLGTRGPDEEALSDFVTECRASVIAPNSPDVIFPYSLLNDLFTEAKETGRFRLDAGCEKPPSYCFLSNYYVVHCIAWSFKDSQKPLLLSSILTHDAIYCFDGNPARSSDYNLHFIIPLLHLRLDRLFVEKLVTFTLSAVDDCSALQYIEKVTGELYFKTAPVIMGQMFGSLDEFEYWKDMISKFAWDLRRGHDGYARVDNF